MTVLSIVRTPALWYSMISAIRDALYFPSQSQCWAHLWIIHGATRLLCINRMILIISATSTYAWCHAEKSVVVLPSFQIQNTFTLLAKLWLTKVFFYFFCCTGRAENHRVIKGACSALRADLKSLIREGHHMKIPEGKFIYSAFPSTNCNPLYFQFFSESSSHDDKPVYLHTSNRD